MEEARVQVDQHGRLLFPSKIRKKYNIKKGDIFIMRVINDEIRIISLDKAVENAQNLLRKYIPENTSLVEELIANRKQDNIANQEKFYGEGRNE